MELAVDASFPHVAVSSDGEVAVSWVTSRANSHFLVAAHEADAFEPASTPALPVDARIAATPGGGAHVVWSDSLEGDSVRHGARRNGGWRWTAAPISLPPFASEPGIVASSLGDVLFVWNQWTGNNRAVAVAEARADGELRLPRHVFDVVSPLINFSNNPEVVLNPDGQAAIVWFQAADDVLDTFVSERRAGSNFFEHPAPTAGLSTGRTDVDNPVVAMGPTGELAVAWRQELGDGTYALFLATKPLNGTWVRPESLGDNISEPADVIFNTAMEFAQSGDLYLSWQQRSGEDKGVFLLHRLADGVWNTPPSEPLRLSEPDIEAFDPALVAGERGVVISWTERTPEMRMRVVARRSSVDLLGPESARWGSTTVLSATGVAAAASRLSMGGDGDRAACVWTEDDRVMLATID